MEQLNRALVGFSDDKQERLFVDTNKPVVLRVDMRKGGSFVKHLNKPWIMVLRQL